MGYKVVGKKNRRRRKPVEVTGGILRFLSEAYIFLMLCIFPLYYQNKYYNMGEAKYLFFKYVTLGFLLLALSAAAVHLFLLAGRGRIREFLRSMSVTDWFAAAYGAAVILSYLLSDYRDQGIWGYDGWYMGLAAQLCFVAVYFLISRFWKWDWVAVCIGCIVAAAVFLLGVLNRFTVDPLGMYQNLDSYYYPLFLSTIGQATWYSSYLCTVFPLGLYIFWKGELPWQRLAGGIFTAVGFSTMVTQNSDSAFIGFLLILLVFFWFSFESNESFLRFWQIVLTGLVSFKLIGILQALFPDRVVELEPLSVFSSQSPWMLALLVLTACVYLILLTKERSRSLDVTRWMPLKREAVAAVCGMAVLAVLCVVLVTKGILPESLKSIGYLNFDDMWGNGRGFTWKYSASMFADFSILQKLIGLGPDCYAPHTFVFRPELVNSMWGDNVLTNAHNEWFTSVLFFGVAGGACYIGIFLSAVKRFAAKAAKKPFLTAIIASVLGYMGHNFFCYQQVVCTSLIFLILGIGEMLAREKE